MRKNTLYFILIFMLLIMIVPTDAYAENPTDAMVLEFDTNLSEGTQIELPLDGDVNVTVNWGDGSTDKFTNSGKKSHTYDSNGIYTVTISGTLTQFGSGFYSYDADKLIKVKDFGNLGLISLSGAFNGCRNLVEVPETLPATVTDMSYMFKRDKKFNGNISGWDVSKVTNMSGMFSGAKIFNGDISGWDVSKVNDMSGMFEWADAFNQDIGKWDVSNVTHMYSMFYSADVFNQDIGKWDVSNVTGISSMFFCAKSFNQDISSWNVSKVSSMYRMFYCAESFNQDIGKWDVSSVTNMSQMFDGVKLSTSTYNSILNKWSKQNVHNGITLDAPNCMYSAAAKDAHNYLENDKKWDIKDGGMADSTPPDLDNLTPADATDNQGLDDNLTIRFNENVVSGTGNIKIYKASDDSLVESIDVTDSTKVTSSATNTITIDPATTLEGATEYYVQIDSGAFEDENGNAYPGINDKTTWSFITVINIPDSNLKQEILDRKIDNNGDGEISISEAVTLYSLKSFYTEISDLSGLEHFKSLDKLVLYDGKNISDLSPLQNLTNLTSLTLDKNNIEKIDDLANLTNLTRLYLSSNKISDISVLANLTKLTELNLANNSITDASDLSVLENLTELEHLSLEENEISEIDSLSNLTKLNYLHLGSTNVEDISSLKDLTALNFLNLNSTYINDEDLSVLSNFKSLTELYLQSANDKISDISVVADLTNLKYLYLGYNQISDIRALSNLANLTSLYNLNANPLYDQDTSNSIKLNTINVGSESYDVYVPAGNVMESTGMNEAELDNASITLELYPTTFANNNLKKQNFVLGDETNELDIISIDKVEYLSPNKCKINLKYNLSGYDFDEDIFLRSLQIKQAELADDIYGNSYDSLKFSDLPVIKANNDSESIKISDDGNITLGKEDGEVITVKLTGGQFLPYEWSEEISELFKDQYLPVFNSDYWKVENLPEGVSVGSIDRIDDTTVEITLSGNSTQKYKEDITDVKVVCPGNANLQYMFPNEGDGDLVKSSGVRMSGDNTRPTVNTYSPENGEKEVAIDTNLEIEFNEDIEKGSGDITIFKDSNDTVFETIYADSNKVSVDDSEVVIKLDGNLDYDTKYYVNIEKGCFKDESGNEYEGINNKSIWSFRTVEKEEKPEPEPEKDKEAPEVKSFTPEDGEKDVAIDTDFEIRFNEDIEKGSGDITIFKDSNDTVFETIYAGSSKVNIDGREVSINLEENLKHDTTYYINIEEGCFKDKVGNKYEGINDKSTWSFRTEKEEKPEPKPEPEPEKDTEAPEVEKLTPKDGEKDVAIDTDLEIRFNEDIEKGFGDITIFKDSDDTVFETIYARSNKVKVDDRKVAINLDENLEHDTKYYVNIAEGCFKDKAGNEYEGITDKFTWNFITEAKKDNGNSSSGGSKHKSSSSKTKVNVEVNGKKQESLGEAKTETKNGQRVTTVKVDTEKLAEKLKEEGRGSKITIPVKVQKGLVVGELNGQMVKTMEQKEAIVEIKTEKASYTLPAQEINIDEVSKEIGQKVELKDIKVKVEIGETPREMAKVVENTAKKENFTLVVPSVDFKVECTNAGKTVEVKRFNNYVERLIAIPEGVDPNKITTGLIMYPDETTCHVPTKVIVIDGKYYAKINSLTNSTYGIIWNPREYQDVKGHWAEDVSNEMGARKVVKEVTSNMFSPEQEVTRVSFTETLVRSLGLGEKGTMHKFTDVDRTKPYYGAVATGIEYNLVSGYEDNTFRAFNNVTREEAAALIVRAMKIAGLKVDYTKEELENELNKYKDKENIGVWAREVVAICSKSGMIIGYEKENFMPKENMTRAELSAIMERMLKSADLI